MIDAVLKKHEEPMFKVGDNVVVTKVIEDSGSIVKNIKFEDGTISGYSFDSNMSHIYLVDFGDSDRDKLWFYADEIEIKKTIPLEQQLEFTKSFCKTSVWSRGDTADLSKWANKDNNIVNPLKQAWEELESVEEPLGDAPDFRDSSYGSTSQSAFNTQVGGNHYKDLPIQPVEFILANGLGFCEGNVVKYICRYKQKNGIQDLKKVIHYAQLLIEDLENDQPLIKND